MKQLIIMRHAKAEKDSPSGEDFDRRLTENGRSEARSVILQLRDYGLKPDFALVSSAARTFGTFDQAEMVMGRIASDVSKALYNAGASALRAAIEKREDEVECLLVVGHNPGVQALVGDYLLEGAAGAEAIDKVRNGFPTAAAAVFNVDPAGRPIFDGLYLPK